MIIELDTQKTKPFFDEINDIQTNYKKYLNNPDMIPKDMSQRLPLSLLTEIVCFIVILRFNEHTILDFIFLALISLFLVITVISIVVILVKRNQFIKNKTSASLEVTEDDVKLIKENETVTVLFDEIKYILINQHSICFLPEEKTTTMICINIHNKDLLLEALTKVQKTQLVIDHTE